MLIERAAWSRSDHIGQNSAHDHHQTLQPLGRNAAEQHPRLLKPDADKKHRLNHECRQKGRHDPMRML